MSNSLDPDQARQFVGPDLDLNCLQRLSADDTSFVLFGSLRPCQQLWSCLDGQFTEPQFFPGQARPSS